MKTFLELTEGQQEAAITAELNKLLHRILEGFIRFSDEKNKDDLQTSIDRAMSKAESMQTPWFAHEYIMEAKLADGSLVSDYLRGMAIQQAQDALYASDTEYVVNEPSQ